MGIPAVLQTEAPPARIFPMVSVDNTLIGMPTKAKAERKRAGRRRPALQYPGVRRRSVLEAHAHEDVVAEQQLIADNSTFSAQSRDDKWAEATEFMIAHLAQSVTDNQLRILDSECRNNLCRIELAAPKGLNPEFRALVLKYAATLKAGDLEFHDLKESKDRIMLELKSDKRLQYGFFAERALKPAEREQWLAEVKAWLGTQQHNKK